MHKKYLFFVITGLILTGLIMAGCGGQKAAQPGDQKPGQVLVVGARDPVRTLDNGFLLVEKSHIAETLMAVDESYRLKPVLAESWKQVDDNTWEFTLRKGVKFHDGSPLTAADAASAIGRAVKANPRTKSLTRIAAAAAVDGQTLRLTTEKANPLLPEALSNADLGILARGSFNEKGELVKPTGTGPYKLAKWDQATGEVVAERNPDYWGEAPRLDKMVFKGIPDANTRALALEKGEIDFTFDLPYGELDRLGKVKGVQVALYAEPRIYRLELNMTREPFSDLKVRQALNYAIDRTGIVKNVLHGCGEAGIGPFMHDTPWCNKDVESFYRYNPEQARALLTSAGWVDQDGDGIREKGGKPFAITIMTWSSRPGMPPMAEALQAQFREIGIKADVQILEYGAIYNRVKEGNWDTVLASFQTADPHSYLSGVYGSKGSQNVAKYANNKVDGLIDEAARTPDPEKRYAVYRQIQEIITRDTPVINVACYKMAVGMRDYVKGFKFNPMAHDLHTNPEMYIEK
ncbi:MAG: ABC transporter substrate-binding protein [Bacillota bacterium]